MSSIDLVIGEMASSLAFIVLTRLFGSPNGVTYCGLPEAKGLGFFVPLMGLIDLTPS